MELRSLIWKVLKEEVDQNTLNLKNKYVGEGKPISEDDFNKIVEATGNKFYLLSWLTKKVGTGIIKAEDVYKYKEYFDIYEKNKSKFEHKDIHLYKTADDLKKFLGEVIKVREGNLVFDEISGRDNYVSQNDIEKLEASGGVKYLGMYDNGDFKYQVFQIFGISQDVWKLYRDILGRCKGRDKGAKIDICTVGHYKYFKMYLKDDKDSNYFLLFNLDDRKSPYQLHYESGQFMDKNDDEDHGINQLKFFKFVGDKVPKYSLEQENFPGRNFEVPVPNKGFLDDKGRKQGAWKTTNYSGGIYRIATFKNDYEYGPYEVFHDNGKLNEKGFYKDGTSVGQYEEYFSSGKLREKGVFSEDGEKIGVWFHSNWNSEDMLVDYDSPFPHQISGLTPGGKVRFVSRMTSSGSIRPYGKTIFFGRTGKTIAIGNMGVKNFHLGKWTYYSPNGSIRAEGSYRDGKRTGFWTDIVKSKDGQTYIFEANFVSGYPDRKVKVYNKNGEFLKNVKPDKISPERYWDTDKLSLHKFT